MGSFNPLGLFTSPEQIQLRTTTNPYFTLRLAPNPLIRVSSHYPLLHPPTNSFWYRIGTDSKGDHKLGQPRNLRYGRNWADTKGMNRGIYED